LIGVELVTKEGKARLERSSWSKTQRKRKVKKTTH
jgi:hypothetical protein